RRAGVGVGRRGVRRDASASRFFFQAEDGIRDKLVTGVQTFALPIWKVGAGGGRTSCSWPDAWRPGSTPCNRVPRSRCSTKLSARSEERRVGKECREWCARAERGIRSVLLTR